MHEPFQNVKYMFERRTITVTQHGILEYSAYP